jgi:hypothetical protein
MVMGAGYNAWDCGEEFQYDTSEGVIFINGARLTKLSYLDLLKLSIDDE